MGLATFFRGVDFENQVSTTKKKKKNGLDPISQPIFVLRDIKAAHDVGQPAWLAGWLAGWPCPHIQSASNIVHYLFSTFIFFN